MMMVSIGIVVRIERGSELSMAWDGAKLESGSRNRIEAPENHPAIGCKNPWYTSCLQEVIKISFSGMMVGYPKQCKAKFCFYPEFWMKSESTSNAAPRF